MNKISGENRVKAPARALQRRPHPYCRKEHLNKRPPDDAVLKDRPRDREQNKVNPFNIGRSSRPSKRGRVI